VLSASHGRHLAGTVALILTALAAPPAATSRAATAQPSGIQPGTTTRAEAGRGTTGTGGTGDEGSTPLLRDVLDAAGRGYLDAKAKLDASKRRQLDLTLRLRRVQERLDTLSVEVGAVAAEGYRTGRLGPVSALLHSRSPDAFLERAAALETMAALDDHRMRELNEAQRQAAAAKAAIDAEVAQQRRQMAIMTQRKQQAERALAAVGGRSTGGFVAASSPVAKPAPRGADGSWPPQSCSVDDPTTSACITPRMLHTLKQARAAGFTRFVGCFRPGGPYEHPKGRACDFSAQHNGFGGDARGGDRLYGNNLAAFLVRNADRLGLLYVIWYRQIWVPGAGWRSYGGAYGDPSSDHSNHVHVSVY
jgi:hypothetical protein